MKLLLIILTIYTNVYGNNNSPYSNNHHSYSSVPVEQTYRGIGYSTNYSNGQFNSTQYYQCTYTPTSGSSGGSISGGPRRVKGYNENGNEINTGNNRKGNPDDMWNNAYEYYWDGSNWWRKDANGDYYIWINAFGWRWYEPWGILVNDEPPPGTPRIYKDNPVPIGDAITPLLSLLLLYMFYDPFIRHTLKK